MCSSHPDLVPALEMAENVGRRECESSFKAERWNCSGFSILKAPNITNKGRWMYVLAQDRSIHALHICVPLIFAPIHVSVKNVALRNGSLYGACGIGSAHVTVR